MTTTNKYTVLWSDPAQALSKDTVREFTQNSLEIRQIEPADLSNEDLRNADLLVLHVQTSIDAIVQLQSRIATLNLNLPIVARVDREKFELGMEIVRKIYNVIPTDHQDVETWTSIVKQMVTVPKPQ